MWVSGSDELLDDGLVDLGILADRLELDLLAGLGRQFAHQARHAREHRFDRLGADRHHRVLQPARRLRQHFEAAHQFLVAGPQRLIHLLGQHRLGDHQFAHHVDHAIDLVEIDADRLHAVAAAIAGSPLRRSLSAARRWLRRSRAGAWQPCRRPRPWRAIGFAARRRARQSSSAGTSSASLGRAWAATAAASHRTCCDRRRQSPAVRSKVAIAFDEFEHFADRRLGRVGEIKRDFPAAIDAKRLEIGERRNVVQHRDDARFRPASPVRGTAAADRWPAHRVRVCGVNRISHGPGSTVERRGVKSVARRRSARRRCRDRP